MTHGVLSNYAELPSLPGIYMSVSWFLGVILRT